jgi:cellulose synthase/poly-beta-1,6-N-acetylglucosamine synthase-like glycosyltransferase
MSLDVGLMRSALLGFSATLSVLFFPYGLNFYFLMKKASEYSAPKPSMEGRERVTIQLPTYNERYVVVRLLKACREMVDRYGKDLVQILILDDSTDVTTDILRDLVSEMRGEGYDVELIHRDERAGFKAGALQNALAFTKNPLIAIFDADFIPPADFLERVVPYFGDPRVGLIQCKWAHVNRDYNLVTKAIAIGYDGHHIVEQAGRCAGGYLINFNGSAGVLRREALIEAGGWQSDTLAEDLDVSYRMQLLGWKAFYIRDIECLAEIPPTVPALKRQQSRWASGSIRVFRKMLPKVLLDGRLTLGQKVQAAIHLSYYSVHPLMASAFLIAVVAALFDIRLVEFDWSTIVSESVERAGVRPDVSLYLRVWLYLEGIAASLWRAANYTPHWLILNISIFFCAISMWLFYAYALRLQGRRLKGEIKALGALGVIGFGISLSNTISVMRGLFGRDPGVFARTPKYRIEKRSDTWRDKAYQVRLSRMTALEIGAGLLGIGCILKAYFGPVPNLGIIPILWLYTCAYLYVARLTIGEAAKG